jgi:3D (Asp-Asp-Asp) domain-containing protein
MFPLLVGSTVLVLGHTALTQQTNSTAPAVSVSSMPVQPAEPAPARAETGETPRARRRGRVAAVPPEVAARAESGRPATDRPTRPVARRPARETARKPEPDEPAVRTVTVRMRVTGYCPCRKCCGKFSDGKTASGKRITYNGGKFIAADTSLLPFGTRVSIPGYNGGRPVPVEDRGGRIKGRRLDLFFYSHHQAKEWGAQWVDVTVYLDEDE